MIFFNDTYILHDEYKKQTYYGPFSEGEVQERLHDPFSLDLTLTGRLMAVCLSEDELDIFYVYPAEFWYSQLDHILGEDLYKTEHENFSDYILE